MIQEAKKILAILPAYNEARTIEAVIDDLFAYNVIPLIIDDGSSDATATLARAKGVRVIRHRINQGQGASLMTGFTAARRLNADIVVTFDSDGQHQAKDIPALIAPILEGSADVVLGSRFLQKNDVPTLRRVILSAAVWYTRLTTGLQITDTHNGLRAFNRTAVNLVSIQQSGMAHASELLEQIADHGLRYTEVPVSIVYTEYSLGKGQRLTNSFKILFDLWFK